jgi:hypothetical protein
MLELVDLGSCLQSQNRQCVDTQLSLESSQTMGGNASIGNYSAGYHDIPSHGFADGHKTEDASDCSIREDQVP